MDYKSIVGEVKEGLVVDVGSLYAMLSQLEDRRHARGIRYSLVTILLYTMLAKLAGEDRLSGISEWVCHRQQALAEALGLERVQAPHRTTYSRILGQVIDVHEFEQLVAGYFRSALEANQSIHVAIDGKSLRGSIPSGQTQGVHLLAAFVPEEGWVLMQVEVDGKENEITAAPRLLKSLDLRDKVVTGDAMFTQRELSIQVVDSGGEYVWTVKDNQPQLREEIATVFEPQRPLKGFSAAPEQFSTASTVDKGHGRIEQRTLWASEQLKDYLDWPHAQQVFMLERHVERIRDGRVSDEAVYGITSLNAQQADAKRLLELVRNHWHIENKLHYRRDETLREDWCHLRMGHAQRMMAAINNLVLGLLAKRKVNNVPQMRRRFAAHWHEALELILNP